jgi:hypothetical protein
MSEHDEQVAFINWCKLNEARYPGLDLIFAIPNGGKRHPVTAMKLKAEGVRPGVPDLCLPVARGYHGLYIEMKDKHRPTTLDQKKIISRLIAEGYRVEVCYSCDEAIMVAEDYLALDTPNISLP